MSNARELSAMPNASLSFKNRIINGAMQIWQRGTSSTTSGVYGTADRWLQIGTSATWSQSTDVPTGFRHSMSVSGSNFVQIVQRIESLNCTDLVGETITFSFWLKQTAGTGGIIAFLQYANTSDNFSAVTNVSNSILASATSGSWVRYSLTVHNLPAQVANGIQLIVYANTSGSAAFQITGIQLEKGAVATAFDYRSIGTELALCQRYYYKVSDATSLGNNMAFLTGVVASSTAVSHGANYFPVNMRAAPTSTFSNVRAYDGTTSGNVSSISANQNSSQLSSLNFVTGSGLVTGRIAQIIPISNGAYVDFNAEL